MACSISQLQARLPNDKRAGVWVERSEFEPCCVLWQDNLLLLCVSLQQSV